MVHCCELECHAEKKRKKGKKRKKKEEKRVLSVMSSHSITRQESHTVSYGGIYSVCTKRQRLGKKGRPVQSKQGRERGTGPGEKGWSLSTHLKGSRLEQAHEIRPNCLG